MASLSVLTFDHEGHPIQFDTWLDDLKLYLLSDSRDRVSLFDHTSGASLAPPATADSATRSKWLTRDAAARLAVRNHLPLAERAHFGQHKTAKALYDAVVARYSSPATAALGRLLLPYLSPELPAFPTEEDLVTHLHTSNARYRAALPAEFLDMNLPPMYITLYFIVTRLPDTLRAVRDHFLALDPTYLTINLLEQHLLKAETSIVAVGAARGTPRTPFFEGCSPSPLAPSYASAAAVDILGAADVGATSALNRKRRSTKGKGGRSGGSGSGGGGGGCQNVICLACSPTPTIFTGAAVEVVEVAEVVAAVGVVAGVGALVAAVVAAVGVAVEAAVGVDAILTAMYALSISAEGDCYLCVPPDPGIEAVAIGASESALPSIALLRPCTPLRLTQVLPAVSFATIPPSLHSLHLFRSDWLTPQGAQFLPVPPLFSHVQQFRPAHCPVAHPCLCHLLSHQTLLWHHRLGHPSMPRLRGMHSRLLVSGLPRSLPPLPPSTAPPCLPCVKGRQRAAPHSSSFPPMTAPLQTLHIDVWGPARVSGQGRERYFLLVVDDYTRYTTVLPLRSKGEVPDVLIPWIRAVRLQLRERFRGDLPVLLLHSDRGGEFSSDLLRDFCLGRASSSHPEGVPVRRTGALLDFAAACRLDYATSLVAESESVCPLSVGGECALGTDVLEDRQEDFECLAAAVPHLVAMLLAPEGDLDAPDIPTPRSYAEAITGPYSSQLQIAMDAKMASWKSTCTYVDVVPPCRANIVNGMWIFRVKRPPGSPPVFKARYVAQGFSQRQGVDFFQTFFGYLGLHITRDRARRTITPTQSHMVHQFLQRFGFRYSSPQSTPLPTGHLLSAPHLDESVEPSGLYPELVGCLMYLMTCTRPYIACPLIILARNVAPRRYQTELWYAAKRVLRYLCSTSGMGLMLGGRGPVVLTGHADASWVDDLATQRSSQGYTFSLDSGFVSWRSTRSSSVLSFSCEAEIYAVAMAA
ncbi:unnamed protein product [Closterium sp. NIES-54]